MTSKNEGFEKRKTHESRFLRKVVVVVVVEDRQTFNTKKKLYIGSGSWVASRPEPKTKINLALDSEFNYIHFGIDIKKNLRKFF